MKSPVSNKSNDHKMSGGGPRGHYSTTMANRVKNNGSNLMNKGKMMAGLNIVENETEISNNTLNFYNNASNKRAATVLQNPSRFGTTPVSPGGQHNPNQ